MVKLPFLLIWYETQIRSTIMANLYRDISCDQQMFSFDLVFLFCYFFDHDKELVMAVICQNVVLGDIWVISNNSYDS